MKKILSIFLVLAIILMPIKNVFATTSTNEFNNDEEDFILQKLNIIEGYPDGTLKLNNNITRAEVATLAIKMLGKEEEALKEAPFKSSYSDVSFKHWAHPYISKAKELGILSGYPDETFKPEDNISIIEANMIAINLLGYKDTVIEDWPLGPINKSVELGLYSDVSNYNENASRKIVFSIFEKTLKTNIYNEDKKFIEFVGLGKYIQGTVLNEYNVTNNSTYFTLNTKLKENGFTITNPEPNDNKFGIKYEVLTDNNDKLLSIHQIGIKKPFFKRGILEKVSSSRITLKDGTSYSIFDLKNIIVNGQTYNSKNLDIGLKKLEKEFSVELIFNSNGELASIDSTNTINKEYIYNEFNKEDSYIRVYDEDTDNLKIRFSEIQNVYLNGVQAKLEDIPFRALIKITGTKEISDINREKRDIYAYTLIDKGSFESLTSNQLSLKENGKNINIPLNRTTTLSLDENNKIEKIKSLPTIYKNEQVYYIRGFNNNEVRHVFFDNMNTRDFQTALVLHKKNVGNEFEITVMNLEDEKVLTLKYGDKTNKFNKDGISYSNLKTVSQSSAFNLVEYSPMDSEYFSIIKKENNFEGVKTVDSFKNNKFNIKQSTYSDNDSTDKVKTKAYSLSSPFKIFDVSNVNNQNYKEEGVVRTLGEKFAGALSYKNLQVRFYANKKVKEDDSFNYVFAVNGLENVYFSESPFIVLDKIKEINDNNEEYDALFTYDIESGTFKSLKIDASKLSKFKLGEVIDGKIGLEDKVVLKEPLKLSTGTVVRINGNKITLKVGTENKSYEVYDKAYAFNLKRLGRNPSVEQILDTKTEIDKLEEGTRIKFYTQSDKGKVINIVVIQ